MLSIIIPAKNEENYLPKLLNSIKAQDFSDLEIIIADADSEDKTKKIAEDYGCMIVKGGFPAYGRNSGAREARGDILVFIDSDVILPNGFLHRAMKEFKNKDLDVAGTLQVPIPVGNKFKDLENRFYYGVANFWMMLWQRSIRPYMQVCMFAKKEIHNKIKGFDETLIFGEDSEYAIRAVKAGGKFGIINEKVKLSPRRFEKEGFMLVFKYFYFNLARLFGKEFRENSRTKYY